MSAESVRLWLFSAALLTIVGSAVWVAVRPADGEEGARTPSRKRNFTIEVAEGLSMRRHGVYGVDFVRCGRCRIEKRKIGGFSIGCFNDLVLDDLSVVIPPKGFSGGKDFPDGVRPSPAKELATAIGVDDDFLKANGWRLRFSGLRISRLAVATLNAASNAVPRFVAVSGVARPDGLHLEECGIIQGEGTNYVGRAVLKNKPQLRLEWSGGELPLF